MAWVRALRIAPRYVGPAVISPLQLEFSQLLFVHNRCVVDSTVKSFLRRVFISLWRSETPGPKIASLDGRNTPAANSIEISIV